MPNICTVRIVAVGPREDVTALMAHVESDNDDFDFNQVIPIPTREEGTETSRQMAEYELEKQLWGCGEGQTFTRVDSLSTDTGEAQCTWYLDTPWRAPDQLFRTLATELGRSAPNLNLVMAYAEIGNTRAGVLAAKGGEISEKTMEDWDLQPFASGSNSGELGTIAQEALIDHLVETGLDRTGYVPRPDDDGPTP